MEVRSMNRRTKNKMADQPKLIIFDFDGTLVDSRKLILEAHRVFLSVWAPAAL
jgi:FMN phosphatase YigB (HAD superfamily)